MGFEKVIGYESIVLELKRVCDVLKRRDEYKKLGVNPPSGILLRGEPGVGKTLLANSFVEECGLPYYICRKDRPNGDFVNSIKEKYEEAKKNAPSIIILDDLDKFANEDGEHRNAEEYVTVQACIDTYKGKGVFTFATANDIYCFPDSLLRAGRFDKRIDIHIPRGKCAEKIITNFISTKPILKNVDGKMVAKLLDGRSCAELESIVNEAGIIATFENKKQIDTKDMVRALLKTSYESYESLNDDTLSYKDKIAYHEAGHTVISEVLEPESVMAVSAVYVSGDFGGITLRYHNSALQVDEKHNDCRIIGALGGKAATEIVYGCLDLGTYNDIKEAGRMVARLICDYGKYGFVGCMDGNESQNAMGSPLDQLISSELQRYYTESKRIIVSNREFLDKLAKELMEKDVLVQEDIARIKNSCKIVY